MFTSPYPDEVIPKLSVYDFLFTDLNVEDAARVALIDGPTGAETTYGALKAQIDLLAGALAARGLGIGDVVALHSPNVPAFASVFHGILRSGATATTVNALATADDIASQLKDSKASFVFIVSPCSTARRGTPRCATCWARVRRLRRSPSTRRPTSRCSPTPPAPPRGPR